MVSLALPDIQNGIAQRLRGMWMTPRLMIAHTATVEPVLHSARRRDRLKAFGGPRVLRESTRTFDSRYRMGGAYCTPPSFQSVLRPHAILSDEPSPTLLS
jgi:hypothetical protein